MLLHSQLLLEDTYLITGENPNDEHDFINRVTICLKNGIKLLQLRANQLSDLKYITLAKKIQYIAHQYNAKLILNCSVETFEKVNADGLQLNSSRLYQHTSRPLDQNKILSASCHNKEDLIHSESIGANFVTLSPVLPTNSHPGSPTLGWKKFSELATCTTIPIFALGGVGKIDIQTAKDHGAIGIAAISSLWETLT